MDKQTFTRTVTQVIIVQLAMLNLGHGLHYRILSRIEGPRALLLNLQIRQRAIKQFEKLPVGTFSLACRQALRANDALPIRVANGPEGTLALEIGKPEGLWIENLPASLLDRAGQGLIVPVGVSATGQVETLDFANPITPHGLVAGVPGSGKTNELLCLIRALTRQNDPREVRFIFVDASTKRGRDFKQLDRLAHRACAVVTELEMVERVLAWTLLEMARRGEQDYDSPHIFLIVDEIIDLLQQNPRLADPLARITMSGRALGIHALLVAHNPTKENIKNRDLAAYAPTRLVGKVADDSAARVATGLAGSGAEALTGSGDMLYINPASNQLVKRIIGPLITAQDIEALPRADMVPEFSFGHELAGASGRQPGRGSDPFDYERIGELVGYLATCYHRREQPRSASTLGKALSPMWNQQKMERHLQVAKKIYLGMLKAGYDASERA